MAGPGTPEFVPKQPQAGSVALAKTASVTQSALSAVAEQLRPGIMIPKKAFNQTGWLGLDCQDRGQSSPEADTVLPKLSQLSSMVKWYA